MNYEEFRKIPCRHVASLFREQDKFTAYKNISIHLALPEIAFFGDWVQMGVFRGHSARILESFILPGHKLHLFDSFEGLPEEWSCTPYAKGHFSLASEQVPVFDPTRSVVHKGWFNETLPVFVASHKEKLPFIHLDADLYTSTTTALELLNDHIVPGTILLFDEFFLPTEHGISDDECRAFFEWAQRYDRHYEILWRTEWVQCAVRVIA